jgi:Cu-Zn family superoxide dismutase
MLAALVLGGGAATALAQAPAVGATSEIRDASGRLIASAEFREGRGEVLVTLNFPDPPTLSGSHAIHIDDVGRCDPPSFSTSGAIFNPYNKKHGRQNPEGAEVGDLPNVNFSTGLTTYNTTAIGATLGPGPGSLLMPSRSVVIYSGEDDQKTDPDGNPGAPIGCGVIVAAPAAAAAAAPGTTGSVAPAPAAAASPSAAGVVVVIPPPPAAQAASSPAAPSQPIVVVNNSASPSPIVVAAIPTPIRAPTPAAAPVSAPQPAQSGSNGLSASNALIIAVLGAILFGVGLLLRSGREQR